MCPILILLIFLFFLVLLISYSFVFYSSYFCYMKFVLDVKENKAATLLALLNDLPYVKTKPLTPYKAKVLEDLKQAVEEMNLILAGKIEARDAEDLLNEL